MGPDRKVDVPVHDLSLIRGIWEVRVQKHRRKQREEQERVENSALARIDQQWQYRIYCRSLKTKDLQLLGAPPCTGHPQEDPAIPPEQKDADRLTFRLEGERWTAFPGELQWRTYLQEWCVQGTRIQQLPDFLALFTQLTVLDIPKNAIRELPPDIGRLSELRRLNASYNRLSAVPAELGGCQKLQRLELAGNGDLSELPFELSSLKQLLHLDIAENRFASIPICALRMTRLQLLDLSGNGLTDLPQDMDRLENLSTLFIHRNHLSYLPMCLAHIPSLRTVVVSGDRLTCTPTKICSNPDIKFIRLYDKPISEDGRSRGEEGRSRGEKRRGRRWTEHREEQKESSDKEFMEAYLSSLEDRDTVPCSTTKVSFSCRL
ncbi:leucine-rich repeat-containing protein 2 [Oryzias melastigma]|uniref:leucine-rich repeat-containing protein 2 n=1 Tax=Oryzias melastigma TaxID=30732 RepID=UPI000CF8142C|nr:leucine-rich repeat-containing protein 2 [Oryzias melastigma]